MKFIHKKKRAKSYAIAGIGHGKGVTHLALTIANFCHSGLKEKVTYIELSRKSALYDVVNEREIVINDSIAYRYKGVNYVLAASAEEAKEILLKSNMVCVVDIDELNNETKEVFTLAERKMIIGSIRPWRQREFIEFSVDKIVNNIDTKGIAFLCEGINKEEKKKINQIFDFRIMEKPLIRDPFYIRKEEFSSIETLLK